MSNSKNEDKTEEIFPMTNEQKNQVIHTVGVAKSYNKLAKNLKELKKDIFEQNPDSFRQTIPTDIGLIKFTQNDAQSKNKKNELKEKSKLKRKSKNMTCKERKEKKLFVLPKEGLEYDKLLPMNNLWKGYIKDLLESVSGISNQSEVLLKADYHGCLMKCTRSKCPSYVNIEGLMIQETENTFKILTKENQVKIIPKGGCIFHFKMETNKKEFTIEIYGDNFRYRSFERSAKKFKRKDIIDL